MRPSIFLVLVLSFGVPCAAQPAAQPAAPGGFRSELFLPGRELPRPSQCEVIRRGTVPLNLSGGLLLVDVRINGRPARMVLDTGAERSVLGPEAAKRLGVTDRYDFDRALHGIAGGIRTGDARLQSLDLGTVPLAEPRVLVGKMGPVGGDGLLGADLLGAFDLEIDGPRRLLALYDRLECGTLRPPWPGLFGTLETTRSLDHHPFFPVQIDGRTVSATLDTGAQITAMSGAAASQAGVSQAALAADKAVGARGLGGGVLRAVLHRFRAFTIGGQSFAGPVLVVPGMAMPRDSAVVIGLDFVLPRRIWLSYGSRRLFVSTEQASAQ